MKTLYFLRRNGLRRTFRAVRERLKEAKQHPYVWNPPSEEELARQRSQWEAEGLRITFSILVPAYRTREAYLQEMMESLRLQTYPKWELLLADATEDDSVRRIAETADDSRIRYIRLEKNTGIAGNSNQGLTYAAGDYVGLLDHDDVLTPDALYETAARVEEARRLGTELQMLYSDEDKFDGTVYFDPNEKEDFNLDRLLSNNYICHFLVLKRELIQALGFREEYDGAQDYDLILRAASALDGREQAVAHIPKVLYHWRCHETSTAQNPKSKQYAYEAGRRALQDFADRAGWHAIAAETAHVGFYILQYTGSPFESRQDIGAIGGVLVCGDGKPTEGGRLHLAGLSRDVAAVDIRSISVRPECRELFREVTGVSYQTIPGGEIFDSSLLPEDCDFIQVSLALCDALREAGYRILYLTESSVLSHTGKGVNAASHERGNGHHS